MPTLAERIAELRKRKGWTQAELAEKLGVHKGHVTRWETDRRNPSPQALAKMVGVFGVRIEELRGEMPVALPLPEGLLGQEALIEKMQQVLELDADDQAVVFRIIDSLATQKRVAQLVTAGSGKNSGKKPVANGTNGSH
jgi:transcriptional regulator with XRE-family HTH domain